MSELFLSVENSYISDQAENALAGCLLVKPEETIKAIKEILSDDDFQNKNVKTIYMITLEFITTGKPCDPVLVQAEAAKRGVTLDYEYCAQTMQMFITTANVLETARIVHDAATTRKARSIGIALAQCEISPMESLRQLQELLTRQNTRIHSPQESALKTMDYISNAAYGKTKPFLSTGYESLDAQLSGGLVAGGLITLAARPGTGKTTAAICIAENVSSVGNPVLYVSLEMTVEQLWSCRIANISGLSRSAIYSGSFNQNDELSWKRLNEAMNLLYNRPFYIRDIPSSLEDIEREARSLDNISLLVIDHLGLIKATTAQRSTRYEFMTDTTHKLKQLALSLHTPVLALSQLNRSSELRESKRPSMADLRDSGAIEEDSDAVCLLFRESQYLPEELRPKPWENQDIIFIVDKNRHGMTGEITLEYCGMTSRIMEKRRTA